MSAIKRIGGKVWTLLFIGLVVQILFDPLSSLLTFSENIQARVGLPIARASWDSQNINHYKFDIGGFVSLQCIISGNIEVKDGIVVGKGMRSDGGEEILPAGGANSHFLCDYHNYTIPVLFYEIEQSLRFISRISFDGKYGFTSFVGFGSPGGNGLLSTKISDCCTSFKIENFESLDE